MWGIKPRQSLFLKKTKTKKIAMMWLMRQIKLRHIRYSKKIKNSNEVVDVADEATAQSLF